MEGCILTEDRKTDFERRFSEKKVKALLDLDEDKPPGLDGYHECWDAIKLDLVKLSSSRMDQYARSKFYLHCVGQENGRRKRR